MAIKTAASPVFCLNKSDMTNLQRLVWICSAGLPERDRWIAAIWARLRVVSGTLPGEQFETRHIPVLVTEIERILIHVETLRVEFAAIAALTIARIEDNAPSVYAPELTHLDEWHKQDIKYFAERVEVQHPTPYNVDELA